MLHPTDTLYPPYTLPAEIDRKIRPLIEACWSAGLRTVMCCQGTPKARRREEGLACIGFCSALEAMLFITLAGPTRWTTRARSRRDEALWGVEGCAVSFPHEDIELAAYTLRASGWTIEDLIVMYSASRQGGRHEFTPDTAPRNAEPHRDGRQQVRTCQQCRGAIPPSRRRDAIYCSRRCQLRARRRAKGSLCGQAEEKTLRKCFDLDWADEPEGH